MRNVRSLLPTVLSTIALALAFAAYAMPRAGSAADVGTTAAESQTINLKVNNRSLVFSVEARLKALGEQADEADAKILRLEREVAALKSHTHTYNGGMSGFGIVNLATLKTMLDRMAPSDARGALPIAFDGFRVPTHLPQTGPPVQGSP